MLEPPLAGNEKSRLAKLKAYEILDTLPEPCFDELAELAALICDTPIALVSLVDEKRQWFKARIGLDAESTARCVSFCGHVVVSSEQMVVEDARSDPRFADNPLVTGPPHVIFYAGAPLATDAGTLGTLCVIDHKPRQLSVSQLDALSRLSRQVVSQLELRLHLKERERARRAADEAKLRGEVAIRVARSTEAQFFKQNVDLLCVANFEGYFRQLNPAWEALLGIPREDLLSRPFIEFIHPDDREATFREVERLGTGEATVDFENRCKTSDGRYRWLTWRASADLQKQLIYATARDITDRKAVAQLKDDFLATVSHELRTPLTSIRGSLGLVLGGTTGEISEDARNLLQIACDNTQRLVRLVNDMLDIEKYESEHFVLQRQLTDLANVVREAIEANEAYAAKHNVRYVLATDSANEALAQVDPDRIRQVMDNLLSNAAKYAEGSGDITVSIGADGDSWRVGVRDNGPGVGDDFEERLFERFAQEEMNSARRSKGTGLGLAICRAIVDLHGGSIAYQRPEKGGSDFFFRLPRPTT